ncbi:nuclease-related domain-containing protein [Nitrincola sp.]|uniref:nuclease-related domain-containing protein n=1 Tax=Nitrincola sp. TaxID=1926584 RepID=UPI003A8F0A20
MDILSLYAEALTQFWFIIPLFIVIQLFKSRWFKGIFGEFLVNRLLSKLPAEDYTIIKDVTLPTADGTTQIDHIIISRYGIFVVETKNMKGWIFGSATQAQWTQKIYRHTSKFQNPIHQNYKHIKTLEAALGCPTELLHSVIVFVGDSEFKTDMPDNVIEARQCLDYIRRFQQPVLNTQETRSLTQIIEAIKLKPGIATDLAHRQHVKEMFKVSE